MISPGVTVPIGFANGPYQDSAAWQKDRETRWKNAFEKTRDRVVNEVIVETGSSSMFEKASSANHVSDPDISAPLEKEGTKTRPAIHFKKCSWQGGRYSSSGQESHIVSEILV